VRENIFLERMLTTLSAFVLLATLLPSIGFTSAGERTGAVRVTAS
jgi:hypothetical protein